MIECERRYLHPEAAGLVAVLCHVLLNGLKLITEESLPILRRRSRELLVSEPVLLEVLELLLVLGSLTHELKDHLDLTQTVIHDEAPGQDLEQE